MKYAWIKENSKSFTVSLICKVLKLINRSAYYHWLKSDISTNEIDIKLQQLIKDIFMQNREVYGTRRIKDELVDVYGILTSRRYISKVMKSQGLVVKMKRRFKVVTTDSRHNYPIVPNRLNRDFKTHITNSVYVGDIIYIPTQQGWFYLAVVIDLFSRKVVGWSKLANSGFYEVKKFPVMDDNMKVTLVNDALSMAINSKNPPAGLIWHTDKVLNMPHINIKNYFKNMI